MNQKSNLTSEDFRYQLPDDSLTLGYRKYIKYSQNRHIHKGYEVLLVLSGERQMFVDNKTYFMNKADLLLIPPETLHKSPGNTTGSEIIYAVYYNTSPSLAELLGNKSRNVKLDPLSFSYIHKLMEKMIREFEKEEIGFEIALNASAEDLLVYLLRIPKKDIENINREKNEINSKMMKIAEFINDHYQEELTLNTLSDQFYISSSYLSRSFHKETGFSLIEYINNIRILKVKEQLISTNDSISTISERCGFGSVTNFGRIFKSITEMSPREYRKKQIAGL